MALVKRITGEGKNKKNWLCQNLRKKLNTILASFNIQGGQKVLLSLHNIIFYFRWLTRKLWCLYRPSQLVTASMKVNKLNPVPVLCITVLLVLLLLALLFGRE